MVGSRLHRAQTPGPLHYGAKPLSIRVSCLTFPVKSAMGSYCIVHLRLLPRPAKGTFLSEGPPAFSECRIARWNGRFNVYNRPSAIQQAFTPNEPHHLFHRKASHG